MLLENAGNEKITTLTFSVNRNGSTYGINEPTRQLNGTFSREAIDVVIYEINPNALSDNKITLYKNDETVELEVGKDYTINKEGGEETWNKYTYTIFKDNFQDDGIYRISTYSTDELGNISENTLDIKNMEIAFGIDKTAPKLIITNLESDTTYAVEQMTVIMYPTDNIKLCEVNVTLDGKEVAQWNEEQIEQMVQDNQDYTFDIPGNVTKAHRVTVELKDAAANRTVQEITNFYVTTDKWTQFHTNKVLVFGSVVCGVAGIGCGFVFLKRRF